MAAWIQRRSREPRARWGQLGAAVLVALLLGALPGGAIDYSPSSLERMLGLADLVVLGEVEKVLEDCIVVRVERSLGDDDLPEDRIEIVRYELYDERAGPATYEVGQEFVWLLSWRAEPAAAEPEPRWHVFGAEGEGELPVAGGSVCLRAELVEGAAGEEREIHGRRDLVVPYGIATFWDAAEGYRRCVEWDEGAEGRGEAARVVCPRAELGAYAGRSELHRQLAGGGCGQN